MNRGLIDGMGGRKIRIRQDRWLAIEVEPGEIEGPGGYRLIPVIGFGFGIVFIFIFLLEAPVQLAFTLASDSGVIPIHAKAPGDIVLVGVKVGNNKGFAEYRQDQGQQYASDRQAAYLREQVKLKDAKNRSHKPCLKRARRLLLNNRVLYFDTGCKGICNGIKLESF